MEKLGSASASWVIPKHTINKESVCYCFGCGEDISFDLEIIERYGCNVYAFDPTPRAVEYVNKVTSEVKEYHFSDFGLWYENTTIKFYAPADKQHVSHSVLNLQKTDDFIEVNVRRLNDILKENGHNYIDLLKIDIEGAEYKVIESILEDKIPIKILCVEFDECFNPLDYRYMSRITDTIRSLISSGYILIFSSGNGNFTFLSAST